MLSSIGSSTQSEILTIVKEIMSIVCQLQNSVHPFYIATLNQRILFDEVEMEKLILLDFGIGNRAPKQGLRTHNGCRHLRVSSTRTVQWISHLNTDVYSVGVIALHLLTRREPRDLLWGNTLRWESSAQFLHKDWREWLAKDSCIL